MPLRTAAAALAAAFALSACWWSSTEDAAAPGAEASAAAGSAVAPSEAEGSPRGALPPSAESEPRPGPAGSRSRGASIASLDRAADPTLRAEAAVLAKDVDLAASERPAAPLAEPSGGPERVAVSIRHSLEASLSQADAEIGPALAQVAKRVLVWWMDVRRDLRRGDELELMFERAEDAEPTLHWIAYTSEKHGQRFEAVRFQPKGDPYARYYHRDGREVEARLRSSPIESYEQVTSLIGDGRRHKGVDFKAPVGTPILAPFDGRVTRRNWSTRGNGRCLEVTDEKTGVRAMFLHLSKITAKPGQRVARGEPLGESGNTGRSTAPHLHYQLEQPNSRRIIDPLRFHETYHRSLPEAHRADLQTRWAEIDAQLRPSEG